ncbi:MAG: o-succinylbenzoate--CoA ligase [Candidatus Zixiibacteriota bacterium]
MTDKFVDNFVVCPVRAAARSYPDRPALITPDGIVTFEAYDRQVSAAAAFFKEQELPELAVMAENTPLLPPLLMGAFRAGTTVHLLSHHHPTNIIETYLKDFHYPRFINITGRADFNRFNNLFAETVLKNVYSPSEIIPEINLEQPATVMMTSGSSAEPKAVLHLYGNHYYNALGSNRNLPFGSGDHWLWSLPAYHVGGLSILFRAALGGGAAVIDNGELPLTEKILKHRITHLSLVPTQLYRLLQEKENLPEVKKQLRAVLLGGGPTTESLLNQALAVELPLYKTYGLTETASQVCTTAPGDMPAKAATSGRPLEYRRVKISDSGEILVSGPCLFAGYREKDNLVKPFDNDGWFATGDCGFIDRDGYLIVISRKDNLFISGGENIQPEEIERLLCRADNIAAALVVPVLSEEFGFRPAAFIKTADNSEPDRAVLEKYLQTHLPRYKIPDYFFPWPEKAAFEDLKPKREEFIRLARSLVT